MSFYLFFYQCFLKPKFDGGWLQLGSVFILFDSSHLVKVICAAIPHVDTRGGVAQCRKHLDKENV